MNHHNLNLESSQKYLQNDLAIETVSNTDNIGTLNSEVPYMLAISSKFIVLLCANVVNGGSPNGGNPSSTSPESNHIEKFRNTCIVPLNNNNLLMLTSNA